MNTVVEVFWHTYAKSTTDELRTYIWKAKLYNVWKRMFGDHLHDLWVGKEKLINRYILRSGTYVGMHKFYFTSNNVQSVPKGLAAAHRPTCRK